MRHTQYETTSMVLFMHGSDQFYITYTAVSRPKPLMNLIYTLLGKASEHTYTYEVKETIPRQPDMTLLETYEAYLPVLDDKVKAQMITQGLVPTKRERKAHSDNRFKPGT